MEVYQYLIDLWNSRNSKNWSEKLQALQVQEEITNFKKNSEGMNPVEFLHAASWFSWIISKIYAWKSFQEIGSKPSKTTEEEREAKDNARKQAKLEAEVQRRLQSLKFSSESQKPSLILEEQVANLSEGLFFDTQKTSEQSAFKMEKLSLESLFPYQKDYDLLDIMKEIESIQPKTLFNACQLLPKYDWLDVFQALMVLNQENKLSLIQEEGYQDIHIQFGPQTPEEAN